MKKLLTIALALSLVSSLQAQRSYLSSFYAGLNTTGFSSIVFPEHNYGSSNFYTHQFTPGFSGGLTVGASVNDVHSFQLEFNYSLQGQNFQDVNLPDPTIQKKEIDLTYLKVPFLYRYTTYLDAYSASSPSFYFAAGVYTALLQNGSVTYMNGDSTVSFLDATSVGNSNTFSEPLESRDLFSSYDFGAVLGLGFEFPLVSDLSFTIESRTEIGMTDINAINWRYPSAEKGYRPSLNLTTGIRLGLVYNLFL